ncbi:DNA methyltransferase [Taklimakanibacter deserti]|uniref:DNA methyltransferase n=1 Tax=Taklimakanibacter deserti TaxID=2267839 RepID=UPI0013C3F72D
MFVPFEAWTGGRSISSIGTNAGAPDIPFQNWRRFKEAFPPEFVAHAISQCPRPVKRCLDPFGGSGTTALACQFLGVHPTTIEVNPFLADLIESKLVRYDATDVARSFADLVRLANRTRVNPSKLYTSGPETLIEPGVNGRWIFDWEIAARLAAYVSALPKITNRNHRRLFRVILGGVIVDVSNVIVSGKGRRYRRNWINTRKDGSALDTAFCSAMESAIGDIVRFTPRRVHSFSVLHGNALQLIPSAGPVDISIFSPPSC